MFTLFRKIPSLLLLLIPLLIAAFPAARRHATLQLGLMQNATNGYISTVWPQAQPALALSRDHWYQILQAAQYDEKFNEADTYILQHPAQIALLAERARCLFYKCWLPQRDGDLGGAPSPFSPQSNPLDKEYVNKRKKTTKVLLVRIRELCLLGQKQEPQNAYFDMLLSIVSYAQYKDEQGWRYLQSALSKQRFDPHYDDLRQLIIENEERILQRPLLWEEKMYWYSAVQAKESSAIRNWGRWLGWQAILRIRAMQPREAMRVQSGLSEMGMKIIRESRDNIVASWGTMLMSQGYYAPHAAHTSLVLVPSQNYPHTTLEDRYNWVQNYAQQHHLPQLQQMGVELLRGQRYVRNAEDAIPYYGWSGASRSVRTAMFVSWTFCVLCLFYLASALIFWCASFPFRRAPDPPDQRLVNITSAIVTLIILGLVGGIFAFALSGDRWNFNIWGAAIPSRGGADDWQIRGIITLFPWLVALCVAMLVVLLTPLRRTCERIKNADWRQRLKVLLGGVGLVLFPIIMIYFSDQRAFDFSDILQFASWVYGVMYIFICIGYFMLLVKYLRYIYPPHKKGHLVYLMRHALKHFAICCVVIYGISMFVSVMSHRVADREIRLLIAQGEMTYFGNRADLTDPIDPHQFWKPR